MIDKLEETVHDNKTLEIINPETYLLTHIRFSTYMVLLFSNLNKAQIYKMPYRDSPYHEYEFVISFNYTKLFKPNDQKEDYQTTNDEIFLFEMGNKKFIYVGDKVFSFETK